MPEDFIRLQDRLTRGRKYTLTTGQIPRVKEIIMRAMIRSLVAGVCVFAIIVAADVARADSPAGVQVVLIEPLGRDWTPEWVSFPVELPKGRLKPGNVKHKTGRDEHYLLVHELHDDGTVKRATAYSYTGLKAGERKTLRFGAGDVVQPGQCFYASGAVAMAGLPAKAVFQTRALHITLPIPEPGTSEEDPESGFCLRSGRRIFPGGEDCEHVPAPILACGPASTGPTRHVWRGRLEGMGKITSMSITRDTSVPHVYRHTVSYDLANGSTYTVRLMLVAHEPVVLVEESFEKVRHGGLRLVRGSRWSPTHGHGRGRLHPPGAKGITNGYEIDFSKGWSGRIQPFYAWWHDYGLWWAAYEPGGCYAGILPLNPPRWVNPPPNAIRINTGPQGKIEAFFPFDRGTRKWALVISTAQEALNLSGGGANLMMRIAIRHGQNPLDNVKDMVLTWHGMDSIENPRLLCTKNDVLRIREKARTSPPFKRVLEEYPDRPRDPAGLYLATGNEEYARQAIDDLIAKLKEWVEQALDGSNYGEALCAIGWTRPLRSYALIYDIVASSKSMTAAERSYCLRAFAFLDYCLYDENRWPARYQGFSRGNVNFHSDDYAARAVVTCLLKGHPKQKEWMDYVEREMRFEFESSVYPGGTWCEAPNYQGFTMHYLMIAMRAMQLNGYADLSKDPRFRETMDYFFRIQTPYDVRAGMHLLPTVGDTTSFFHSQSLQNTFSWAATLFEDNPELAGLMINAWKRGGAIVFAAHNLGPGNGWILPLMFTNPDLPAAGPASPLQSERLTGYGAIFRNNYGTDRESYFLFKMGQADQHYDSDEGSFHWYALGMPLSLDFGSMYEPSIVQPWLHSTLDFASRGIRHRAWTRGEVTAFVSLPDVDFCTGQVAVNDVQAVPDLPGKTLPEGVPGTIERHKRFIDWRREVMFVRGADYVVMRDTLDDVEDAFTTGWTMQVLASEVKINGSQASFVGQHGVDLNVFLAEPVGATLSTSRWGHPGRADWDWTMEKPMPQMGETQIALQTTAPVDGDYLATMFPYRHGSEPAATSAAGKDILRVRHNEFDDLIFFSRSRRLMQAEDVTFAGRVGIVRRTHDAVTLHIVEGFAMRVPEMIAQFPGPVTINVRQGRLTGTSDGAARTCFLHWADAPPVPARLTIDSERAYAYSTFDGYLSFTIPAGRHRFEVTYDLSRN